VSLKVSKVAAKTFSSFRVTQSWSPEVMQSCPAIYLRWHAVQTTLISEFTGAWHNVFIQRPFYGFQKSQNPPSYFEKFDNPAVINFSCPNNKIIFKF
jgi:hypothetical protein